MPPTLVAWWPVEIVARLADRLADRLVDRLRRSPSRGHSALAIGGTRR